MKPSSVGRFPRGLFLTWIVIAAVPITLSQSFVPRPLHSAAVSRVPAWVVKNSRELSPGMGCAAERNSLSRRLFVGRKIQNDGTSRS